MKLFKKGILLSGLIFLSLVHSEDILSGSSYPIKSKFSGDCLEVEGNMDDEGRKIVLTPCSGNYTQDFQVIGNNGEYNIVTSNGKNLAIASSSKSNGVNIVQSSYLEQFNLEKQESGFYKIKSVNSGKYITAKTYTNDVVQYSKHDDDDQLWGIGTTYTYGSELISNGTFDSSTNGWTAVAGASLSIVNGAIKLVNTSAQWGFIKQYITTEVGKTYLLSATFIETNADSGNGHAIAANSGGGIIGIVNTANGTTYSAEFTATETQTEIQVVINQTVVGRYAIYDNISVKEIIEVQ